ncbi:AMP binding protein [Coprinopsis cinerea AmutBmut pab1-1]|nr:AMP binding protein [Coprinopsis cinerea AmutBmut pab1-1]
MLSLSQYPEKFDMKSLTALISGGAPLSSALVTDLTSKLARQGSRPVIINGYGSTETTLTAILTPPKSWRSKLGSAGVLAPNIEARIIKEIANADVVVDAEPGEPGELWIRGPTVMKGYLRNETATKESFHDGWYKTGDILRRDEDGFFYVIDRKKEMIKYKGLQVAPAELEAVLSECSDVADVGVIGVPDDYSGNELPRAYVVPTDRTILDSSSRLANFQIHVQSWIKGRVARYKELRGGVVAVNTIPKSPTGKVLRRELRELAIAETRCSNSQVMSKL